MSICNIYTPNIQNVYTQISVYTLQNQNFLEYMEMDVQIILQVTNPYVLKANSSNTIMGAINNIQFYLQPRLSYPIGSSIIIRYDQGQILQNTSILPISGIANQNIQFLTKEVIIQKATQITGQDILSFQIVNFLNPIGVSQEQFSLSVIYNNSVIEQGTTSLTQSSITLTQGAISVQNLTYGALTTLSLAIQTPFELPHEALMLITIPKQLQIINCINTICSINGGSVIIQSYFMQNRNIYISMTVQLPMQIICSNDFGLQISSNNVFISTLSQGFKVCTDISTITLISIQTQVPQSNIHTNYQISMLIPESGNGAFLSLDLPLYYKTQLNSGQCYAQFNQVALKIELITDLIIINDITKDGGLLQIKCNLSNQRYVWQYNYQIQGSLMLNNQKIASLNTQFVINLDRPDIIPNVSLINSNQLAYQHSVVQLQFSYPLLDSDTIRITVPYTNITSCLPLCQITYLQNQSTLITVNSSNTIILNVINSQEQTLIAPFILQILNNGLMVAYNYDPQGLGYVIGNQIYNLSVALKPAFLGSSTILTLSFNYVISIKANQSVSLSIPQGLLSSQELSCTQYHCLKQSNNNTNYVVLYSDQNIEPGQFNTEISGLQILVLKAQQYSYNFSIIIKDQYQNIISELEQPFLFDILCSTQCLTCSIQYNYCESCQSGLYLYEGECRAQCLERYAPSKMNICVQCQTPITCLTCNHEKLNICEGCINGYDLINEECVLHSVNQSSNSIVNLSPDKNQGYKFNDFPLLIIISAILLIITVIVKIQQKKSIKFLQLYCLLLSSLELIASVLRIIHFGAQFQMGYLFLAIAITGQILFMQVQGAYNLIGQTKALPLFLDINSNSRKFVFKLSCFYQWKFSFYLMKTGCHNEYLNFIKLLQTQVTNIILPIVTLISYIHTDPRIFAIDDLCYLLLFMFMQVSSRYWNYTYQRISPDLEQNN